MESKPECQTRLFTNPAQEKHTLTLLIELVTWPQQTCKGSWEISEWHEYLFIDFYLKIFIWLCCVLVAAHRISSFCHAGSFVVVCELSVCITWALECSVAAACVSLTTLFHLDLSSLTRDQTHGPCIERWIINYWTTKEVPLHEHCCYFSVAQSCPTLCSPMDCSTPGFPVLYHLPELAQTHVHWVVGWCHPTISSSGIPFPSCLQSFPASESFLMSQLFALDGQSIGASASASILPMNIQGWSPLGLTVLISLQSQGLSRVFFNNTVQKHQFFNAQSSLWSNSHIHTWLLEKTWLWLNGFLLAKL